MIVVSSGFGYFNMLSLLKSQSRYVIESDLTASVEEIKTLYIVLCTKLY